MILLLRKLSFIIICCLLLAVTTFAQIFSTGKSLTLPDTLRGSVTPARCWWDVRKYEVSVEPDYSTRIIRGSNIITCEAVAEGRKMQIDLQQPMNITRIIYKSTTLKTTRTGNAYWVYLPEKIKKATLFSLEINFEGKPHEAINPPWDGGWIWKKDAGGAPWVSVACQGLGASVWYPCKDYQGDEPDSATLHITVPDSLTGIGNGRLRSLIKNNNGTSTYTWAVINPINNYNIIPYIGRYVHWSETYAGEQGNLDLDYWVLRGNEAKAKKQFLQVPLMLRCFEYWFGPYPFYEDGYKLIEAPHLGMEHQSAVAYGNKFENGYLGKDLSETGWGLKWDFIIVHESGHEWFGNNITTKDIADMWVHEGLTSYSETLFTQCQSGKDAGNAYCIGTRKGIQNDVPIIGRYGVNKEGSVDMYDKGSSIIHMIRQLINNDEKFREILRGLNKTFYHQTVTTRQVEDYFSLQSGIDLHLFFDQYLRTTQIPAFEYKYNNGTLSYRWADCLPGFNMPLKIMAGKEIWISPTGEWQTISVESADFSIDRNFYVHSRKM